MDDLLVIVLALAFGSLVKGMTGSGLPQVAIPVMATFLGPERAVVIMAIPGVVSNGWLLWSHRRHLREARDLPALLGTGVVGAVAGTWLLTSLPAAVLALVLAAMIVVYVVLRATRVEVHLPARVTRWASPPVGLAAGALQGATGISGPLLTTYVHAFRLEKHVYVVSLVTLFLVFSVTQVVTLAGVGLYTPARLGESLLAMLPMAVFLPLGIRLSRRLSGRAFDNVVLVVLALTAAKLVVDGVAGL